MTPIRLTSLKPHTRRGRTQTHPRGEPVVKETCQTFDVSSGRQPGAARCLSFCLFSLSLSFKKSDQHSSGAREAGSLGPQRHLGQSCIKPPSSAAPSDPESQALPTESPGTFPTTVGGVTPRSSCPATGEL